MLDAFDLADNTQVTGSRDVTTVAPQALFMMNDPFVLAQAKALAAARDVASAAATHARVDRAYSLALGRIPTDAERQRALKYVRGCDRRREGRERREAGERRPSRGVRERVGERSCQALFAERRVPVRELTPRGTCSPARVARIESDSRAGSPIATEATMFHPTLFSRRDALKTAACGFGYLAFAGLRAAGGGAGGGRTPAPSRPRRRTSRRAPSA